jgi:hypothetical protein
MENETEGDNQNSQITFEQESSTTEKLKVTREKVLILTLSIMLIITIGIFYHLYQKNNSSEKLSLNNGVIKNDKAMIAKSNEKEDINIAEVEKICFSQEDIFKDYCYLQAAIDQLSLDICQKVSTEMQVECQDAVNEQLAYQKEDVSYCLKMSQSKGTDCVVKLASLKGDASLCQNVYYKQDLSSCEQAANTAKLISQAITNKDRKFCDEISFYQDKSKCYGELGIALNSPFFCELANEKNIQGGQNDFEGWGQPKCYKELALLNANVEYCDKIMDFGNWGEICKEDVAAVQKVNTQCMENVTSNDKAQCLIIGVKTFKLASECDEKIDFHSAYAPLGIKNCYHKAEYQCAKVITSDDVQSECRRILSEHRTGIEKRLKTY